MKVLKTTDLLLGVTVLMPLLGLPQFANAQAPGTDECDRLITMMEQNTTANSSVTLSQARTYKENSNTAACRDMLEKVQNAKDDTAKTTNSNTTTGNAGGEGGNIVVQQAAPTVSVESPSPQVTVQQEAPTVSVNQGQPEITVHQPAPVVTIEIPKPEITVRMPKPSVEVAQAAPQVVVNQPKPEVRVVQPPAADVNTKTAQANVDINQATNPVIHYESEQPQVHVNQAQGEPTIKVEQFDPATPGVTRSSTASLSATGAQVTASELTGKVVTGPQGQRLGTVKTVILDGQDRAFLIVEYGGVLGIGARQIPIPAQNVKFENGQVRIEGLTIAQINSIPVYKSQPNYRSVQGDQTIPMVRS